MLKPRLSVSFDKKAKGNVGSNKNKKGKGIESSPRLILRNSSRCTRRFLEREAIRPDRYIDEAEGVVRLVFFDSTMLIFTVPEFFFKKNALIYFPKLRDLTS